MAHSIAESSRTEAASSALDSDGDDRLSLLTTPSSNATDVDADDYHDDPLITFSDATTHAPRPRQSTNPRRVIGLMYLLDFILLLGGGLMTLPCLRIIEQILCHHYYNGLKGDRHLGFEDDIDEGMCKGTEVQEDLNVLLAAGWVFGTIPALLTSVPYGLLADRIGRRPVFILALVGLIIAVCYNLMILAFWKVLPIRLVWLSSIFTLIGGGETVTGMMFFAIINDVTTDANRSSVFLYASCASLSAQLISPSLASALMARSPWIPILFGLSLLIVGICLLFLIPETLKLKQTPSSDRPASPISSPNPASAQSGNSYVSTLKIQIHEATKRFRDGTDILHSFPIVLLLVTFIQGPFIHVSSDLAPRYVSNRYSLPLHLIGYLLSVRALVNLLLIIVILPLLSHYLTSKLSHTSKSKDLILAQLSVLLLTIGQALIGFAPTLPIGIGGMVIWTLGMGFGALTRSLITTLVEKDQVGKLYAVIAVVEVVCGMAAGPIQAVLYAVGLKWKGMWQGLPYFMLAGTSALAGVAIYLFGYVMRGKLAEGEIRLGGGFEGFDDHGREDEVRRGDDVALETEDGVGVTPRLI